jgi:hypothetical protein
MMWSVSLQAEGDRVITLEEVVELADAVAGHSGIATGMGTNSYGIQILVEADDPDQAVLIARDVLSRAVDQAGLPVWPIVNVETIADEAEMVWYQDIPDGWVPGDEER